MPLPKRTALSGVRLKERPESIRDLRLEAKGVWPGASSEAGAERSSNLTPRSAWYPLLCASVIFQTLDCQKNVS